MLIELAPLFQRSEISPHRTKRGVWVVQRVLRDVGSAIDLPSYLRITLHLVARPPMRVLGGGMGGACTLIIFRDVRVEALTAPPPPYLLLPDPEAQ